MDAIATQAASLGVAGLLFVMWWYERQERVRTGSAARDTERYAEQMADLNTHLLDVIRANTDALAALREELRSSRIAENEWRMRLMQRLEVLHSQGTEEIG